MLESRNRVVQLVGFQLGEESSLGTMNNNRIFLARKGINSRKDIGFLG